MPFFFLSVFLSTASISLSSFFFRRLTAGLLADQQSSPPSSAFGNLLFFL
uniref:Uncharacterized protein n=1 Tax=Anguilla anguilla TaxID=7936 RepID=A0A0E9XE37_ANGAN